MVSFKQLNLADSDCFSCEYKDVDLIFCRNVLIYFRPEVYQKIILSFAKCIREGGFLILGHVEGRMARKSVFDPVKKNGTIFFRKNTPAVQKEPPDTLSRIKKPVNIPVTKPVTKPAKKEVTTPTGQVKNPEKRMPRDIGLKENDYSKALQAYLKENYELAKGYLKNQDQDQTGDFETILLNCLISLNLSDYKWFEKCMDELFQVSDVAAEVFMIKAIYKESLQEFQAAIKANKAAIFADKNFFVPHFRLGHLFEKLGEMEKSRRHFQNALRLIDRDSHERTRLFTGDVSPALLSDICKRRLVNGTYH